MGLFKKTLPCPSCEKPIEVIEESENVCPHCEETVYVRFGGRMLTIEKPDTENVAKITEEEKEEALRKKSELRIASAKEQRDYSKLSVSEINIVASEIILTTSVFVANRDIENEIEVISAECVYGMHIFKDVFAGLRDIFGGRSAAMQNTLRDARRTALAELRREALFVGADAVIGVDLDYQEITGGGKNGMIMLVASGTAVSLKR